jgi:mono/diheme cytochrome c family protein
MRFFAGIVTGIFAIAVIGIIYMYTGAYNVAASEPESALESWFFGTTRIRSIAAHASEIEVPAIFDNASLEEGFEEYDEDCTVCHGGPGVEPAEFAEGMQPEPPDLAMVADELSPAELFWIISNGIKMTAMPAMSGLHSEDEIWAIVAFVKQLPGMTAAEYEAMRPVPAAVETPEVSPPDGTAAPEEP